MARAIQIVSAPEGCTHATVYNIFNVQRYLTSAQTHRTLRPAARGTSRTPGAAAKAAGHSTVDYRFDEGR